MNVKLVCDTITKKIYKITFITKKCTYYIRYMSLTWNCNNTVVITKTITKYNEGIAEIIEDKLMYCYEIDDNEVYD
ncbi:MAG: hypothetical protein P8Y70_01500 [Candidatus Lokiarchaeota archaeon]